jgi:hypothetical protein
MEATIFSTIRPFAVCEGDSDSATLAGAWVALGMFFRVEPDRLLAGVCCYASGCENA